MSFFDNVRRKVEISKAKVRSFNRERDIQRQNKSAADNLARKLKEAEAKDYLAADKLRKKQEVTIKNAERVRREKSFIGRASRAAGSVVKNVERARFKKKGGRVGSLRSGSLVSTNNRVGGGVDRSVFNLRR